MTNESSLIAAALLQIDELITEVHRLQDFVNQADKFEGREPRFANSSVVTNRPSGAQSQKTGPSWSPGAFYGKPLAGAVRMVLLARFEAANGPAPASVDEIHAALSQGSFDFEMNNVDAQKNGIKISLGKNSTSFVKLPNSDLFGLPEWYGIRSRLKSTRKVGPLSNARPVSDEAGDGEEAASEPQTAEEMGI